jgi:hypothetical protein
MRVRKSVVVLVTAGAVVAAGVAFSHSADAGTGSTKYTHSTRLTQATCTIHANYPNAAKSFAIGNVRAGEPFYITKSRCGKNQPGGWILGYAPESGRWGYVQARHLPACH